MTHAAWIRPIADLIERNQARGGFFVIFPEYRPDQFLALAKHLGLAYFDYRDEVMSEFGWDADRLSLDDLDTTLRDQAVAKGTLVSNVEALLATKSADERKQWIQRFIDGSWGRAIIIPIVINAPQVPETHQRVYRIAEKTLPEQTLINRLSF